jgi:hypothetical protein
MSISVSNKFKTIADVCNELFLTDYTKPIRKGWFSPNTFKKTPLEDYSLWFPKFDQNKTGWENDVNIFVNSKEIISKNDKEVGKAKVGQKNITFTYRGGIYSFIGIFQLVKKDKDGKEYWKKICDKCIVFAKLK